MSASSSNPRVEPPADDATAAESPLPTPLRRSARAQIPSVVFARQLAACAARSQTKPELFRHIDQLLMKYAKKD